MCVLLLDSIIPDIDFAVVALCWRSNPWAELRSLLLLDEATFTEAVERWKGFHRRISRSTVHQFGVLTLKNVRATFT